MIGVSRNGYNYYYMRNAQGDVIALYNCYGDINSRYVYDSWGKLLSVTNASGTPITDQTQIAHVNPIRYRGYYYDKETGLFYVGSRYYDPEIGRWISPDNLVAGVGGPILGNNLYAYCFNNPINMDDPSGQWPKWVKSAVNWVKTTFNIQTSKGSVTTTNSSVVARGPTISQSWSAGSFSNKGSGTLGYAEGMFRGQFNQKGNNPSNTLIGGHGKASAINYSTNNRIGTQNVGISKKDVLDIGVVNAYAAVQWKEGPGVALGGKASVATARGTYCMDVFGWQLEVGMDASVLAIGYEFSYGSLPEGGWGSRGGANGGLFGFGYVIRLTPS